MSHGNVPVFAVGLGFVDVTVAVMGSFCLIAISCFLGGTRLVLAGNCF